MIPVAIVAHPRREAMAHTLARQVQADAICWDVGKIGAEANHMQAWSWLAQSGQPWGVVLEDDVVVCEGFREQLEAALECAPSPIVSLYLGRGRPPHWQESIARAAGGSALSPVSWLMAPALLSGQGYAMHTELFAKTRHVRWQILKMGLPIDEAVTAWNRTHDGPHAKVAYTWPSLVDHRDGPTLVDHYDGPRNGLTALMAEDCDPSGAAMAEVRKAWQFGAHQNWDSSSIALVEPLTTIEEDAAG